MAAAIFVALQYNCCGAIIKGFSRRARLFFAMTAICPGFGLGKALNSPKFSR
jgi:hypothetical protein